MDQLIVAYREPQPSGRLVAYTTAYDEAEANMARAYAKERHPEGVEFLVINGQDFLNRTRQQPQQWEGDQA